MASLFDELNRQLGGQAADHLSRALGADPAATRQALPGALATLMGALAHNTGKPEGAAALAQALERDHDGGVLDDLQGFLGGSGQGAGEGILRHVLGARQGDVATGLSQSSGLDAATVSRLLAMLAPLVLGALGKAQRQGQLSPADLAGMLGNERRKIRQSAPAGLGGVLGQFLDSDGDGDISDDVARIGTDLLGKLFGR